MRLAVVGAGAWGTTMASVLAGSNEVTLWAREPEVVESINDQHRNQRFMPDMDLSPRLRAVTEVTEALAGVEAVLMAVPAQHFRPVLVSARRHVPNDVPFLTLSKGIEEKSLLRMTEVAAEVLIEHDPDLIGVLSGPNIARQVLAGEPAATVVALRDEAAAKRFQTSVALPSLRIYTNTDVVGCEIGGAVKNVIALGAGMAAGLGFGENTLAALVTRGLAELTRLGVALGGEPLTFLGLAGVGDLVVTCHSQASRNHQVGRLLGEGRALQDILDSMNSVAEGVRSAAPVLALGRRVGVELPICEQVSEVLQGTITAAEAVEALLGRTRTSELHDLN